MLSNGFKFTNKCWNRFGFSIAEEAQGDVKVVRLHPFYVRLVEVLLAKVK